MGCTNTNLPEWKIDLTLERWFVYTICRGRNWGKGAVMNRGVGRVEIRAGFCESGPAVTGLMGLMGQVRENEKNEWEKLVR